MAIMDLSDAVDSVRMVKEALEKIQAQGGIGTVNIERCVKLLQSAEEEIARNVHAIEQMKALLGVDEQW
jgi:hypothetical protein